MIKNIKIVRGVLQCSKTALSIDEEMPEHCTSALVVAIATESIGMWHLDCGLCQHEAGLRSGIGYLIERVTATCVLQLIGLLQDANDQIEHVHSGPQTRQQHQPRAQCLQYCDEVRCAFEVVS